MRRLRNAIVVAAWIALLAVPAAALGLGGVALLDERLGSWLQGPLTMDWRRVATEVAARWPEGLGMALGMGTLLILLWLESLRRTSARNTSA